MATPVTGQVQIVIDLDARSEAGFNKSAELIRTLTDQFVAGVSEDLSDGPRTTVTSTVLSVSRNDFGIGLPEMEVGLPPVEAETTDDVDVPVKKRGRPKGSKNKKKVARKKVRRTA